MANRLCFGTVAQILKMDFRKKKSLLYERTGGRYLNVPTYRKATQVDIIDLLYGLIMREATSGYSLPLVGKETASKLFQGLRAPHRAILQLSRRIKVRDQVPKRVAQYIRPNVSDLSGLTEKLVDLISSPMVPYEKQTELLACREDFDSFFAGVFIYVLSISNVDGLELSEEKGDSVHSSSALEYLIHWKDGKESFCAPERVEEYLRKARLFPTGVNFENGRLTIAAIKQRGYCVRRLEKEDYAQAYVFLQMHEAEFRRKIAWGDRKLADMVYNGLTMQYEKWTAYGVFHGKELISYLDYKQRVDGYIELGVGLTEEKERGRGWTAALILYLRIKFAYNPFCGGTHFYNISMRHSFEAAGFHGATRRMDRTADPADTRCDANCTIYHEASALLKAGTKK